MWLWMLALLAGAQDEGLPPGAVWMRTSPTARVEVIPRTRPDTIELVVTGNSKPLEDQLREQRTAHVDEAWAVSAGSGTWFVTLAVIGPTIAVEPVAEGDGWALITRVAPRSQLTEPGPAPTVEDLLAGRVPWTPARPPRVPLDPLMGDAWAPRLDPREVRLPVEGWDPPVEGLEGVTGLARIDALRKRLVRAPDSQARTAVLQQLGRAHQAVGLHREARYYFRAVSRQRTEWPRAAVALDRADAALATGRWEEARAACAEARDAGAPDGDTLACVAGVALATGAPSPTATARALLARRDDPQARLLAAQLLVLDHRHDEAAPLLTPDGPLPPLLARHRDATLGDVSYFLGDLEGAHAAWRDVGTAGRLGDLAEVRARMIRLAGEPPSAWGQELPALDRMARGRGLAAAEAHHLAAEIGATYDEAELAARHLTALVDGWPDRAMRGGVADRLLAVCGRRLEGLHRAGDHAEVVGFYRDCWRDVLDDRAVEPGPQAAAADSYAWLGLWPEASEVQRRVTGALAREDRDQVEPLLRLARLYIRVGRAAEALETVDYLRREVPAARGAEAAMAVVEGLAHWALDQGPQAEAAWARALSDPSAGVEARLYRAVLLAESGRCAQARPLLEAVAGADEILDPVGITVEDARLAVARCHLDADELGRAREVARTAVAGGELWAEQARWIVGVAASREPEAPLPEGPLAPEAPWDQAVDVLRAASDARRRAAALGR